MAYQFADLSHYRFQDGDVFLGTDDKGRAVGIETERHLITFAGTRSGKGAALIVPNLRRWEHNGLVIDPKGENAELTWEDRKDMGQNVYVLDPFKEAAVPDEVRATFNPLDEIDLNSPTVREDIRAIADGCVMRHNAKDAEWYDGAVTIIAGVIAHVLTEPDLEPSERTLAGVRYLLNLPGAVDAKPGQEPAVDQLGAEFDAMAAKPDIGGLMGAAVAIGRSTAKSSKEFISGARRSLDSFGSAPLVEAMASSTFKLSELKEGRCTVYLVIPSRLIEDHARFFRLFVRLALNAMEKPIKNRTGIERQKASRCLFILDEFYSLGRIDALSKGAGRLAGNGVHLWPFLQDMNQLIDLYDFNAANTFLANSDAHIFFGINDMPTLRYIADTLGTTDISEVGQAPVSFRGPPLAGPMASLLTDGGKLQGSGVVSGFMGVMSSTGSSIDNYFAEKQHAEYAAKLQTVGRHRLAPEEIRALIAKAGPKLPSKSMIVFTTGRQALKVQLKPHFDNHQHVQPIGPTPWLTVAKLTYAEIITTIVVWIILTAIGWFIFGKRFPNVALAIQTIGLIGFIAWIIYQIAKARSGKAS